MLLESHHVHFLPQLLLPQLPILICGEARSITYFIGDIFLHILVEKVLLTRFFYFFQQPLIPPYGTPVPYPAIYPPGNVYAHPSMATVSNLLILIPLPLNPLAEKCEFCHLLIQDELNSHVPKQLYLGMLLFGISFIIFAFVLLAFFIVLVDPKHHTEWYRVIRKGV